MNEKKMRKLKAILIIVSCVLAVVAWAKVRSDWGSLSIQHLKTEVLVYTDGLQTKGIFDSPIKMNRYIQDKVITDSSFFFFSILLPIVSVLIIIKQINNLRRIAEINDKAVMIVNPFEMVGQLDEKKYGFWGRMNSRFTPNVLDKKDRRRWFLGWITASLTVVIVILAVLLPISPAVAVLLSYVCIGMFVITLWLNPWAAFALATLFLIFTSRAHDKARERESNG